MNDAQESLRSSLSKIEYFDEDEKEGPSSTTDEKKHEICRDIVCESRAYTYRRRTTNHSQTRTLLRDGDWMQEDSLSDWNEFGCYAAALMG